MALISRTAAGVIVAVGLTVSLLGNSAALAWIEPPVGKAPKSDAGSKDAGKDTLIFNDGRTITGTIISETPTKITFKGVANGIAFGPVEYDRAEILSIKKGAESPKPATDPNNGAPKPADKPADKAPDAKPSLADQSSSVNVYFVDLSGEFGEDISQSPIRSAFKDAKEHNADYLICTLNNDWSDGSGFGQLPNDAAAFDQIFRANEMQEVFNQDLKAWDKPPKLVFYVKQAMGGASMLPFLAPTIYFAPDARMGGIGNLSDILKSFDEVVRQKQISLRISQAKGLAIIGGYDPRIVDAMSKVEYVLSYTFENGKVKFLERMPQGPNEFLLTDDGKDTNKDDIKALARGEGNDVLTLTADIAQKIGVSKGTVANMDDLLFDLGISRNAVKIEGRSKQIMEGWKKTITGAKKQLKDLQQEYLRIQVSGPTYADRTRQRGQQKAKLQEILSIYKRLGEGISPSWRGQNRMLSEEQIKQLLAEIDLQQAADKK